MPVNYYSNRTQAELLNILKSLQDGQAGNSVKEIYIAGQRVIKGPNTIAASYRPDVEILRVRYALYLIASATGYAGGDANLYPNPYRERITRTRANYNLPSPILPTAVQ